jgi:hypothetical protein
MPSATVKLRPESRSTRCPAPMSIAAGATGPVDGALQGADLSLETIDYVERLRGLCCVFDDVGDGAVTARVSGGG